MQTKRTIPKFVFTGFLVWLLFIGCSSQANNITSPTTTSGAIHATATLSVRPETPTEIVSAQLPTSPPTNTPYASPTPKPTSTRAPTLTPLPTISSENEESFLMELFEYDANCPLPCWWGIVPGETPWPEARNFLATFADRFEVSGLGDLRALHEVFINSQSLNIKYEFIVFDNTVIGINVRGYEQIWAKEQIATFQIHEILTMYGQPKEVWIHVSRDVVRVVLHYPNRGIMVQYEVDGYFSDEQIIGCPQEDSKLNLWLFKPDDNLTFLETVDLVVTYDMYVERYLLLEEATEINVEMFYQTFKEENNSDCLATPEELWRLN